MLKLKTILDSSDKSDDDQDGMQLKIITNKNEIKDKKQFIFRRTLNYFERHATFLFCILQCYN